MSAGTGVQHSEFNPAKDEAVHFLQIWIQPDQQGVKPRYGEKSFKDVPAGTLRLATSKTGRDGSIAIHQDADLWIGKLDSGSRVTHDLKQGRHAWLHVAEGEILVNDKALKGGDSAALTEENRLDLQGQKAAQVLLFDLN